MTYKAISSFWKTVTAFATTLFATHFISNCMYFSADNGYFAMVKRTNCFTKLSIMPFFALLMLCTMNCIARPGFEYLAGCILSPEMAKVTAFVMTSLVLIYPAQSGRYCNINGMCERSDNLITISGFTGFIAFCIVAALIRCNSILALKTIPIFLACMEAVLEEEYGIGEYTKIGNIDTRPLQRLAYRFCIIWGTEVDNIGKALNCLIGSTILTTGFVYADPIAKVAAGSLIELINSSPTLSALNINTHLVGRVAEIVIAPLVLIIASAICRDLCNSIGENWMIEIH